MFVISSSSHKVLDPLSRRRNNQKFIQNNYYENDEEDDEEEAEEREEGHNHQSSVVVNRSGDDDDIELPLLPPPKPQEMGNNNENNNNNSIRIDGMTSPTTAEIIPEQKFQHQHRSSVVLHSEDKNKIAKIFGDEEKEQKQEVVGSISGSKSSSKLEKKKKSQQQQETTYFQSLCYSIGAFFREFLLALLLAAGIALIIFVITNRMSDINFDERGNKCIQCLTYKIPLTNFSHNNNESGNYSTTTTTTTTTTAAPSGGKNDQVHIQRRLFNITDGSCIPYQRNLTFSMHEIVVFEDFCPSIEEFDIYQKEIISQNNLNSENYRACANRQTLPGLKPCPYWIAAVLTTIGVLLSSFLQVFKYFFILPVWDSCVSKFKTFCWFACCCCLCYCCWTEPVDEDDDETCCEKYSVFRLKDEREETDKEKKKMLAQKKREKMERGELTTEDEKAVGEFDLFESQEARSLAVVFRCFGTLDPRFYFFVYVFTLVHLFWIVSEVGREKTIYRQRYFNASLNTKYFYPNLVLAQDKIKIDRAKIAAAEEEERKRNEGKTTTAAPTTLFPPGPGFIPPPRSPSGSGLTPFTIREYSSPTAIVDTVTGLEVDPFKYLDQIGSEEQQQKSSSSSSSLLKPEEPLFDHNSKWLTYQTIFFTWLNTGTAAFIAIYYANWLCYWYSYALAKTSCGADSDSDDDEDEHRAARGLKRFKSRKQLRRERLQRQKLIEVRITFEEEIMLKGDHTDSFANRILFPIRGFTMLFPRRTSSYNDAVRMQRIIDEEFADCKSFDEIGYARELNEEELEKRQKRIQQRMKQDSKKRETVSRSYYKLARNLHMYGLLLPLLPILLTHVIPGLGIFVPITLLVGLFSAAFCFAWLVIIKWFEKANAKRAALIVALIVARIIGAMLILAVFQTMMSYATLFYTGEYAWQDVIGMEYRNRDTQCFIQGIWHGVTDITRSSVVAFVV